MSSIDLIEAKTNDEYKYPQISKPINKKQYVKILSDDMEHHNFQYKEGLNVDTHPFTAYGHCQKGGLYFCELSDAYLFLDYGTLIADVEVPSDAKVYQENNKLKADKIIIKNIKPFREHEIWYDLEFCKKAVGRYPNYIEYAKAQTNDMCLLAVIFNASNIKYAQHQTPEMGLYAIGSNPYYLEYIKNPTYDICKIAVAKNGMVIQYIKNQTKSWCELAINQNADSIQHIKNQTPELCKLAVSLYSSSIRFIENQTPELCKIAVENEAYNIRHIKDQTEDLCWIALKKNFDTYRHIKNPTAEMTKYYKDQRVCIVM